MNSSSDGSPSAFTHSMFIPPVTSYEPMFTLLIVQEVELERDEERASRSKVLSVLWLSSMQRLINSE